MPKSEENNIINAVYNIILKKCYDTGDIYDKQNRAKSEGAALETYIKDAFAGTFDFEKKEKEKKWSEVFSYCGGSNNPPDAILKNGDAIEVKKIKSIGKLELNSSYPIQKLKVDSDKITKKCKECEKWQEKDIIYAVGLVKEEQLINLIMVYGVDYCASENNYLSIKNSISDKIREIPNLNFVKTKELARINGVDPSSATTLRVRNMWEIDHPASYFNKVIDLNETDRKFQLRVIINEDKWKSLGNKEILKEISVSGFEIKDIEINEPDNPKNKRKAKLIKFDSN